MTDSKTHNKPNQFSCTENNILFSYQGTINYDINNHILSATKSRLQNNKESRIVINRIYHTINECVENIITYNSHKNESLLQQSKLVVYKKDNSYIIDTKNIVNEHQKSLIYAHLLFLNSKSKEELKQFKNQMMLDGQSKNESTIGLGLVDMFIKADGCEYCFESFESEFLFNLNFKINALN